MFVNSNQILIMARGTIMASVTFGKCNLWQVLLMANVLWQIYGKCNYVKSIMAKLLWQMLIL